MNHILNLISTYGLYLGLPLAFLGIVFWVYRPSARKRYDQDAKLPFASGPDPGSHGHS